MRFASVIAVRGNRSLDYLQGTILIGGLLENLRRNLLRGVPRVAHKRKEKKEKRFCVFRRDLLFFLYGFFYFALVLRRCMCAVYSMIYGHCPPARSNLCMFFL